MAGRTVGRASRPAALAERRLPWRHERGPAVVGARAPRDDAVGRRRRVSGGRRRRRQLATLARRCVDARWPRLRAARVARPGDRVALLVPPGADLTAAALRLLARRSRHRRRRRRARAARPVPGRARRARRRRHRRSRGRWPPPGRMRLPGRYVVVGRRVATARSRVRCVPVADRSLVRPGRPLPHLPPGPTTRRPCCSPPGPPARPRASSTATASCRRSATCSRATYGVAADDRLVAAFAPFALYGPALGHRLSRPGHGRDRAGDAHRRRAGRRGRARSTPRWCSPRRRRWPTWSRPRGDRSTTHAAALAGSGCCCRPARRCPSTLLRARPDAARPDAEAHTPYGMTEALPSPTSRSSRGRRGPAPATGSASVVRCRESTSRVAPLDETGRRGRRRCRRAAGRDRRDRACARRTSRTATTGCGAPSRRSARQPRLAPHRRRRAPRRRRAAVGRGPAGARRRPPPRRRHPGRRRAAGRAAARRVGGRPSSASGPPGTQQVVVVGRPTRRRTRPASRRSQLTDDGARRPPAVDRGRGPGRAAPARRHPAQLQDRPRPRWPAGPAGVLAGRMARGGRVRVLVTGASGMLGRRASRGRWPSAATT